MMEQILVDGAREYGLDLDVSQLNMFKRYWELLEETNDIMNLTAVTGREEVYRRHFLDSLALFLVANFKDRKVIDVGSGAGFPGIPVKIACPDTEMTLLDSQRKRVSFLEKVCLDTGLDTQSIHGRAEELGREPKHRERYDYSLSRAVARLDVLAELCLPFLKPGGRFFAMKSAKAESTGTNESREAGTESEISTAEAAVTVLGGRLLPTVDYTVPETGIMRKIVVIEKVLPTPDKYPRRFAKIQKKPIK